MSREGASNVSMESNKDVLKTYTKSSTSCGHHKAVRSGESELRVVMSAESQVFG